MYDKYHLDFADELYEYKGYGLINERYIEEDCRKDTWSWGKRVGNYIEKPQSLKGLSSNSYAPFEEVYEVFKKTVDKLLELE